MRITVLAGGVGAARFLEGLCRAADPADVTAICNVGDDFEWHGLHVSPDIDTVIYTLAGLEGEFGWGVRGDTARRARRAHRAGRGAVVPDRRPRPRDARVAHRAACVAGRPLSDVTADLARRRGLELALLPVTDDPHPTVVVTPEGPLDFQDYFVRGRASAEVVGIEFPGAASASPAVGVLEAFAAARRGHRRAEQPVRLDRADPRRAGRQRGATGHRGAGRGGQPHRGWRGGEGTGRCDDAHARPRCVRARRGPALRGARRRVRARRGRRRARTGDRGARHAGGRDRHDDDRAPNGGSRSPPTVLDAAVGAR